MSLWSHIAVANQTFPRSLLDIRRCLAILVLACLLLIPATTTATSPTISGHILDAQGRPLPHAVVRAYDWVDNGYNLAPSASSTTNIAGRFNLAADPGAYHLSIEYDGINFNLTKQGLTISHRDLIRVDTETSLATTLSITFPLTYEISGTVYSHDGTPAPDVELFSWGSRDQTSHPYVTSSDGSFTLRGILPGLHTVSFLILNNTHRHHYNKHQGYSRLGNEATTLIIRNDDIRGLEVTLPPLGTRVSGRLVWPDDTPVDGQSTAVHLSWWGFRSRTDDDSFTSLISVLTSSDGTFSLHLPHGYYQLRFYYFSHLRPDTSWLRYTANLPEHATEAPSQVTRIAVGDEPVVLPTITIPPPNISHITLEGPSSLVESVTGVNICYEFADNLCVHPSFMPGDWSNPQPIILPRAIFNMMFTIDGRRLYVNPDLDPPFTPEYHRRGMLDGTDPALRDLSLSLVKSAHELQSRDHSVALRLSPGANLIGWYGGQTLLSEICNASADIVSLTAFSTTGRPTGSLACPADLSTRSTLEVDFGSPLLIRTSASKTLQLTLLVAEPSGSIELIAGGALVAWPGEDNTSLGEIRRGFGRNLQTLVKFSNKRDTSDAELLNTGDILYVNLKQSLRWLPPTQAKEPTWYIYSDQAERFQRLLQNEFRSVSSYFLSTEGIAATNFDVYFSDDWDDYSDRLVAPLNGRSLASGRQMILTHTGDMAHEYYHILQGALSATDIASMNMPLWLVEGSATLAAFAFDSHTADPGQQREYPRDYVPRNAKYPLSELQSPLDDLPVSAAYHLGALALEFLSHLTEGQISPLEFWRVWSDGRDWTHVFEDAFGISVTEFYEKFAAYRANGYRLN